MSVLGQSGTEFMAGEGVVGVMEALKAQAEMGEEEDYDGMSAESAARLKFQRQQVRIYI